MEIRRKERYSHINIGLKIDINDRWEHIKALDWSESGFNFYLDRNIDVDNVLFRKGAALFQGTIVWRKIIHDDYVILEMILNRFLFEALGKMDHGSETYKRIIKLIRAQGKTEEKEKLLIALKGDSIVQEAISAIGKYQTEGSIYRYGVKVASEEWEKVVKYALEASSVVMALDNIGKGISNITDSVPKK